MTAIIAGQAPAVFATHGRVLDPQPKIQVTSHARGVVDEVVIDANGDRLAWVYQDTGSADIFMAPILLTPTGTTVGAPVRMTPGSAIATDISAHPALNAGGLQLLLQSNLDLPGGANADRSQEVYQAALSDAQVAAPATFQQLTSDPDPAITPALTGPNPENRLSKASVNSDGTLIVFSSKRNDLPGLVGRNADRNEEIFLYDSDENRYYQLTSTSGVGEHNLHPVIDGAGSVVAYLSNETGVYHVYLIPIPEKPFTCEGTLTNQDGIPGNECGSFICAGDPRCPQEVCNDAAGADEDGNGFANCADLLNCSNHPACVNQPPKLTILDSAGNPLTTTATVDENQTLTLTLKVEDPDAGDLVSVRAFSGQADPLISGATLKLVSSACNPAAGDNCACSATIQTQDCFLAGPLVATFTWKPSFDQGGKDYQFTFAADDTDVTSDTAVQVVTVTVRDVNRPPIVSPNPAGAKTIKQGRILIVQASASDLDRDTLTLSAPSKPGGATFAQTSSMAGAARGELRWTPTAADVSATPYGFDISASDARGGTATTHGTITVVVNRPPTITTGNLTVPEGQPVSIILSGSDPDGDPLSFGVDASTLPAGAEFFAGLNMIHWHPSFDLAQPGIPAVVTIRVTATDGVDTVTKDLKITVIDSPPDQATFVSVPASLSAARGGTVTLTLSVRNTGVSTWTGADGYALALDSKSVALVAPASVPLGPTEAIVPGAVKTFTMDVQAPATAGFYFIRTRMSHQGQKFGTTPSFTQISVK